MRRRLRKWLGIAALCLKYAALLKRVEELERQVRELKNQPAPTAKTKSEKQERRQMTNWSEFLREIGQGEEIRA